MNLLINSIIRPYRFTYSAIDLGRRNTSEYLRLDETVTNIRNQKIQYSYYSPRVSKDNAQNLSQKREICLIYAHCNSGCRIQGLQYIDEAIKKGWNVCLFDFAGSGNSQGKIVTLGENQASDLKEIVEMVRNRGNKRVILWGRSMGAATIMFYLGKFADTDLIKGCVLDSPYSDLFELSKQIAASKTRLPSFIIEKLLDYARSYILEEHHFDIRQMKPLKMLSLFSVPLMYVTSVKDQFVSCSHVLELYDNSQHPKKVLEYIDKEHNSVRDMDTVRIGMNFLKKCLVDPEENHKVRKQLRVFSKIHQNGGLTHKNSRKFLSNINPGNDENKENQSTNLLNQKKSSLGDIRQKCLRKFKSFGTIRDIEVISLRASHAQKVRSHHSPPRSTLQKTLNQSQYKRHVNIPNVIEYNLPYKTQADAMERNSGNFNYYETSQTGSTLRSRIMEKASVSLSRNLSRSNIGMNSEVLTSRPLSRKKKIQMVKGDQIRLNDLIERDLQPKLVSFKSEEIVKTPNLLRKHKHTGSQANSQKDTYQRIKKKSDSEKVKQNLGNLNLNMGHLKIKKFHTIHHGNENQNILNYEKQDPNNDCKLDKIETADFPPLSMCTSIQEPSTRLLLKKKKISFGMGLKLRRASFEHLPFPYTINAKSIKLDDGPNNCVQNDLKISQTIKLHKRTYVD